MFANSDTLKEKVVEHASPEVGARVFVKQSPATRVPEEQLEHS